jgi:hypothetical protein
LLEYYLLVFAVGDNPTIDMIGSPDKVINAFGPEVIGQVVDDKVVYARSETKEDGKLYYQFELNNPHVRTIYDLRTACPLFLRVTTLFVRVYAVSDVSLL